MEKHDNSSSSDKLATTSTRKCNLVMGGNMEVSFKDTDQSVSESNVMTSSNFSSSITSSIAMIDSNSFFAVVFRTCRRISTNYTSFNRVHAQ